MLLWRLVLAAGLVLPLVAAGLPRTPSGRHCPTAAVQKVVRVVEDCCGRKTVVQRAPRPGEAEYVQCRCAERKSHDALDSGSFGVAMSPDFPEAWRLSGYVLAWPPTVASLLGPPLRAAPSAPEPAPPRLA